MAVAIDERRACFLARELYGFEATARALPGEYDDNFHLVAPDGSERVLKVMHPARERSLIDLQSAALEHIAAKAPDLALPRVCRAIDGATIATVEDAGARRLVWMLTYVPGRPLAEARPHTAELLASVGRLLGEMDQGLLDFSHPAAERPDLKWDLARAGWIRDAMHAISDPARRALVERALDRYENEVVPALPRLRRSVIHGDANDYNVIVGDPLRRPRPVSVIDLGDMHRGLTVAEPAIAAVYALLGKADPLAAAASVVARLPRRLPSRGDGDRPPAHPDRGAARRQRHELGADEDEVRRPLRHDQRSAGLGGAGALARDSSAPGSLPVPRRLRLAPRSPRRPRDDLARGAGRRAAAVGDRPADRSAVLDLGVGSRLLGADPAAAETGALTRTIFGAMERAGAAVAVGRYDEPRLLYSSALFGGGTAIDERRTVHLGVDLFVAPGSEVHAPLDGVVHVVANNQAELDYGPLVILLHSADGKTFFTLYGHLSRTASAVWPSDSTSRRGEPFARVGTSDENGGWPPHVHFQVILDLLDQDADFPGVAYARERALWTGLSPDPNLLLRIPGDRFPAREAPSEARAHGAARAHRPERTAVLPPAGQGRPRLHAAPVRRDGPRLPRRLQQRPPGRPQPPARRARGAGADRPAQHEHALPARRHRGLRGAPDPPSARAAARLLLPELGERGQRAGAAPGPDRYRSRGRDRARAQLPRPHVHARRREPLQVRRPRRARAEALGPRRALAGRLSRTLPTLRSGGRAPVRGRGRGDRRSAACGRSGPGRLPGRVDAQHGRPDRVPARLPVRGLPARARGRRPVHRGRGPDGLRPDGHALLGVRDAGRRAGRPRARQADRQRVPAGGRDHHPRDRGRLRQRHGVLQHVRRQPGGLRRGPGRARRARGRTAFRRAPGAWASTSSGRCAICRTAIP